MGSQQHDLAVQGAAAFSPSIVAPESYNFVRVSGKGDVMLQRDPVESHRKQILHSRKDWASNGNGLSVGTHFPIC